MKHWHKHTSLAFRVGVSVFEGLSAVLAIGRLAKARPPRPLRHGIIFSGLASVLERLSLFYRSGPAQRDRQVWQLADARGVYWAPPAPNLTLRCFAWNVPTLPCGRS